MHLRQLAEFERISSDGQAVLVALAALVDAVFCPFRYDGLEHAGAAIETQRRLYFRDGLELKVDAKMVDRMSAMRIRNELRLAGWLERQASPRTGNCMRFTASAAILIRDVFAGYRPEWVWSELESISALADSGCHNDQHVCETAILGVSYDRVTSKALADLEHRLLPLLVLGLLDSRADAGGRVGYRITEKGADALPNGPPTLEQSCKLNEALSKRYDNLFFGQLETRKNWQPDSGNLSIPLSCGKWPAERRERRETA